MDPEKVLWYHGDTRKNFFNLWGFKWDRPRGETLNENGPGIYFTTSKEEALRYTSPNGCLVVAKMKPTQWKSSHISSSSKRIEQKLLTFANHVSQRRKRDFMYNWGGRAFDDVILTHYTGQGTLLECMLHLYHDLFNYDAKAYVVAARRCSWSGAVVNITDTVTHFVCWNPQALVKVEEIT